MENPKSKIAMVVRPATGGIRRHVSMLLESLSQDYFEVTLFAPRDFEPDADSESFNKIPLEISAGTNPFKDWLVARTLNKHLKQNSYHLIHAHGLRSAFIVSLTKTNTPTLVTAHNLLKPENPLETVIYRSIGNYATKIVAVSEAVSKSWQVLGIPPNKIEIISNGIDFSNFASELDLAKIRFLYGFPQSNPLIIAIGRFSPEKGFDLLLTAFAEVLKKIPDAKLVLAGGGPEENTLKTQIQKLNIEKSVILKGFIKNGASFLQIADVVAIPSRLEGQGIVALEAMAAAKAVVAFKVGGLAETIIHNETGLLIPPENTLEFAEGLIVLLKNPNLCETMGESGRLRVEQNFTLEQMIQKTENCYQKMIG